MERISKEEMRLKPPRSDCAHFCHRLIQGEFRDALDLANLFPVGINCTTSLVVVLSAPGPGDNDENRRRIELGVQVSNMSYHILRDGRDSTYFSGAKSCGVIIRPRLVIIGEDEQLPDMNRVAMDLGMYDLSKSPINPYSELAVNVMLTSMSDYERTLTCLISCGPHGPQANTKTQMVAFARVAMSWYHTTFITSWYHVPRVARTATRQLPHGRNTPARFSVLGVPQSIFPVPQFQTVLDETRRILQYIDQGDISEYADQCRLVTLRDYIAKFGRNKCVEAASELRERCRKECEQGKQNRYSM